MQTELKNTTVQYGDMEFFIYYFIDDSGPDLESGELILTLGSEDDEFERITSRVPGDILTNEEKQIETVNKIAIEYLKTIGKL